MGIQRYLQQQKLTLYLLYSSFLLFCCQTGLCPIDPVRIVTVTIPGTVTIITGQRNLVSADSLNEYLATDLLHVTRDEMESVACVDVLTNVQCDVVCLSINGLPITNLPQRQLMQRKLTETFTISCEVDIGFVCTSPDCSDSPSLAVSLHFDVSARLHNSFSSGSFVQSLVRRSSIDAMAWELTRSTASIAIKPVEIEYHPGSPLFPTLVIIRLQLYLNILCYETYLYPLHSSLKGTIRST